MSLTPHDPTFPKRFEEANPNTEKAHHAILAERLNQFRKWGVQDHTIFKWQAILAEEMGEFAEAALNHDDNPHDERTADAMLKEAVHTAAVAMQIVEWLMGQDFKPVVFPDQITWDEVLTAWIGNRRLDAIDLSHQEAGWFEITFTTTPQEWAFANLRFRYAK